ncbi:MAG: hypothetical protein MUE95_03755 [Cyclobacteriaceae bacterium]|jgi:hypothetical protein|nr:hypothetical protein [Cyclobacteriaceae bacterium]
MDKDDYYRRPFTMKNLVLIFLARVGAWLVGRFFTNTECAITLSDRWFAGEVHREKSENFREIMTALKTKPST